MAKLTTIDCRPYGGAMLSFGAGVNSVALAILLINNGWRGEIVFADTGCEWPETYCYIDYFENKWLRPRGFEIVRLKGLPWQKKGRMGESLIEYCEKLAIIPIMAVRWCTVEWKVEPIARYSSGREVILGIAADEAHRQKGRICPLVEWGVTREDCKKIIASEGLVIPPKSGCYICPFQPNGRLKALLELHPDLYERAARLERAAAAKSGKNTTLDPRGISLDEKRAQFERQLELFVDENKFEEYMPCVCTL